jgi:tetratricopeptide (TPR) repeat protein
MIPLLLATVASDPAPLPRIQVPVAEVRCAPGDALCQPIKTAATPCGDSGDYPALTCRAVRAAAANRHGEAAELFERAAKVELEATRAKPNPKVDRALAAAGNMWLAADQPAKAAFALDRALSGTGLQAEQRGEALLDRARVAEAQNDLAMARAKLNEAAPTVSDDPFYWYMSAAIAIRENDRGTAQTAIGKALALAPNDPSILFEAGHVSRFLGDDDKARGYWMRAAGNDPGGPIGKAAAKAVELLGVTPVVKSEAEPPK